MCRHRGRRCIVVSFPSLAFFVGVAIAGVGDGKRSVDDSVLGDMLNMVGVIVVLAASVTTGANALPINGRATNNTAIKAIQTLLRILSTDQLAIMKPSRDYVRC